VHVTVHGTSAKTFAAFRTTEDEKDKYASVGHFQLNDGTITYDAPAGSVTTFFAR
jgi:hypothetical protein